jgi:hypothetical protein
MLLAHPLNDEGLHECSAIRNNMKSFAVRLNSEATSARVQSEFSARKEPSAVRLHNEAMGVAQVYRRCEAELLEVLTRVEGAKIYLTFEITSLHDYCVEMLGLTRHTANNFIDVMRTSLEVPALAEAIYSGRTTISKARKICSVINPSNAKEWIDLTIHCSCRVVEKAVALANPRAGVTESLRYVSGDILDLRLAVSEEWAELLKQTKDRLSQKECRAVSTEEALLIVMREAHLRDDPRKRAERAEVRRRSKSGARSENRSSEKWRDCREPKATCRKQEATCRQPENSRRPPAEITHQINLRDKAQCVYVNVKGERCSSQRWLDHHHIKPLSEGGTHDIDNLETLCRAHHRIRHGQFDRRRNDWKKTHGPE